MLTRHHMEILGTDQDLINGLEESALLLERSQSAGRTSAIQPSGSIRPLATAMQIFDYYNLQNAETVDWHVDRLTPKTGGLFDPTLTGGHGNKNRWSFVRLHEPFPNPVMEDPIKKVLGLTQKQYEEVLAGKAAPVGVRGGVVPVAPGSVSGPAALHDALKNINLDREIARASLEIRGTRKTARDAAIKRQAFLKGAKETGVHPADWMVTKVPVLPPAFRPVSLMKESGIPIVSDSNYLYRDLFDANQLLKEMHGQLDDVGEERLAVYNAFKAVTGLGEPIQKQTQEQGVRGFLKSIIGSSPKFGTIQRRLLGSTVDLVGRATISPNPNLDMDEVGVPEEEAWTLYKPFIIRRLVRRGVSHLDAADMAENQDKQAKEALLQEMKERPMVVDRAPVLHKFGVMGFRPVLVQGKALQLPPLVYKGFGGDNIPILQDGQFRIVNLAEFPHGEAVPGEQHAYEVPAGVRVLSHVPGGFKWRQPDRYFLFPPSAAVKVTVGRARSVIVSADHDLYCFDPASGVCRRTRPDEAIGKLTPRVDKLSAFQEACSQIAWFDGTHQPLTADFGYWLGATIGNGWVSLTRHRGEPYPKEICFAAGIGAGILETWQQLSRRLFNRHIQSKSRYKGEGANAYGDATKLTMSGAEIARWLLPQIGHGAEHKQLPDYVFHASPEFKREVLAGILDTDGTLLIQEDGSWNVGITTKSDQLAEQLVWLFALVGVDANRMTGRNNAGRSYHFVSPSLPDLVGLILPLRHPEKAAAWQILQERKPSDKFTSNLIPVTAGEGIWLRAAVRHAGWTRRNATAKQCTDRTAAYAAKQNGRIGRVALESILDALARDDVPPSLIARLAGPEKWDRVTAVTPQAAQAMYGVRLGGGSSTLVIANKLCLPGINSGFATTG